MFRCILLLVLLFCACGNDDPDVVVVQLRPPKIDCEERLRGVYYDLARRNVESTPAGRHELERQKEKCEEENRRNGY